MAGPKAGACSLIEDGCRPATLGGRSIVPLFPVVSQLAPVRVGRDSFQAFWEVILDQPEGSSPGPEAHVFQQKALSLRGSQQNHKAVCWPQGAMQSLSKPLQATDTRALQTLMQRCRGQKMQQLIPFGSSNQGEVHKVVCESDGPGKSSQDGRLCVPGTWEEDLSHTALVFTAVREGDATPILQLTTQG